MADVRATVEVLKGQLEKYEGKDFVDDEGNVVESPVKNDMEALHKFTNDYKILDVTQKLKYNNKGEVVFNFGKYLGKPVGETLAKDKQYYNWMLNKEFSNQVKKIIRKLVKEYESKNK